MLVKLHSLKRHLVHARIVSNKSLVLSGHIFFINVSSSIVSTLIPSGMPFAKYVMVEIVDLRCLHVFHYFMKILIKL
jgi:hypothetical protein